MPPMKVLAFEPGCQVPQPHGPVGTRGDGRLAVRAEGHRPHRTGMHHQGQKAVAGLPVPQPYGFVRAAAQETAAVRRQATPRIAPLCPSNLWTSAPVSTFHSAGRGRPHPTRRGCRPAGRRLLAPPWLVCPAGGLSAPCPGPTEAASGRRRAGRCRTGHGGHRVIRPGA